jgi:hypothetical protein
VLRSVRQLEAENDQGGNQATGPAQAAQRLQGLFNQQGFQQHHDKKRGSRVHEKQQEGLGICPEPHDSGIFGKMQFLSQHFNQAGRKNNTDQIDKGRIRGNYFDAKILLFLLRESRRIVCTGTFCPVELYL